MLGSSLLPLQDLIHNSSFYYYVIHIILRIVLSWTPCCKEVTTPIYYIDTCIRVTCLPTLLYNVHAFGEIFIVDVFCIRMFGNSYRPCTHFYTRVMFKITPLEYARIHYNLRTCDNIAGSIC